MLGSTSTPLSWRRLFCLWLESCHGRFSVSQGVWRKRQVSSASPSHPRFLHGKLLPETSWKAGSLVAKDKVMIAGLNASNTPRSTQNDSLKDKSEMRLLEPHVLSLRLKRLSNSGKIDEAILMLKNAPLAAQNTPVWNTMIHETMKAQRYSLSYQLYIDMKRRGFTPTVRTFQTMFNGLARIEHWPTFPKQLQNAKSLYQSYQKLVTSLIKTNSYDPDISGPFASYIRILGNAGDYNAIFDVYYAMEDEGPLARNHLVYTAMFQSIRAALGDTPEGRTKVAADARLLWSQMIRAARKNQELVPDSYVVSSAVMALSGGGGIDHELAFKIITEYYGLGIQKSTSCAGKLVLSSECLITILRFCNITENHTACVHFYEQVRQRADAIGGPSILDRGHMEEVLKAHLALRLPGLGCQSLQLLKWMLRQESTGCNGPKIRPSLATYNLAIQACFYSADWDSAKRIFELTTGYRADDFTDEYVAKSPIVKTRNFDQNLTPNAEFMFLMLRTAIATKNTAYLRQAVRIVGHLGYDRILSAQNGTTREPEITKVMNKRSFIGEKFNSALADAVDLLLKGNRNHIQSHEMDKFGRLGQHARRQRHS